MAAEKSWKIVSSGLSHSGTVSEVRHGILLLGYLKVAGLEAFLLGTSALVRICQLLR